MTAPRQTVHFTEAGEAADLVAFLARLLHYDRAAAVRLQASGTVLAVFGRPPSFDVLAIRTARLAKPYEHGLADRLDITVAAGDLLESIDERAATGTVPAPVTGPPWAGVLPPRGGWQPQPGLPVPRALRGLVAGAVAEFRARSEGLSGARRTRAALDRIGQDIWSRRVGDTDLPLRAAHAAQALGFLREPEPPGAVRPRGGEGAERTGMRGPLATGGADRAAGGAPAAGADAAPAARASVRAESGARTGRVPTGGAAGGSSARSRRGAADAAGATPVSLLAAGSWLRLRTPYGSIAVRRAGPEMLRLTPA